MTSLLHTNNFLSFNHLMKLSTLATLGSFIVALSSFTSAATVTFSSGGNFTTFKAVGGVGDNPLQNGYLHAGYYTGSTMGLNDSDLRDSFQTWATFGNDSSANGFFSNSDFPATPIGSAGSKSIYLMVTDTPTVALATQMALFTNTTDLDWTYPASEIGETPSVSMGDIVLGAAGASILSGTETTQFGKASIQLVAVPEPSTALLGLLGLAGILRRKR